MPAKKLWKGNVFSPVCQSHVTITHNALDLTIQGSPLVPGPGPPSYPESHSAKVFIGDQ